MAHRLRESLLKTLPTRDIEYASCLPAPTHTIPVRFRACRWIIKGWQAIPIARMEPHGQSPWRHYSPPSPKDGYGETSAKGSGAPSRRSPFAPSPTGETRGPRRRRMEIPKEVKIDLVDIFRRSEEVLPIVEEAIQRGAKFVWMQEGVAHQEAAVKAEKAGLKVVMDRCMKKEHQRLVK